jgi:hypothetical protein
MIRIDMSSLDIFKELEGTYAYGYLNLENGEINLKSSMGPKDKIEGFMTKYPVIKKDFDETLYHAFPEQSFLAIKLSINIKEYLNCIKASVQAISSNYDGEYNPYSEVLSAFDDPSVQKVVDALNGDVLSSIYGFVEGMFPIPRTGIAFTVNGEKAFHDLLGMLPPDMWSKTGDYYTLSPGGGMPASIVFGYKDNKVYVSDDIDAMVKFIDKGSEKNIAAGSLGERLKRNVMLFYVNLDLDAYPEHIKLLLQNTIGGRSYKQFSSYMNIYKELSYGLTGNYEFEASLKLKNANVNALKQILKNIDENTSNLY